jgi:hypothetical protein
MDRTEWPWSWEEEAEWKAELEERHDFLEELIDSVAEDGILAGSRQIFGPPQQEEPVGEDTPENYAVTA